MRAAERVWEALEAYSHRYRLLRAHIALATWNTQLEAPFNDFVIEKKQQDRKTQGKEEIWIEVARLECLYINTEHVPYPLQTVLIETRLARPGWILYAMTPMWGS